MTAMAAINEAIESGNAGLTFRALCEESAHVAYLDEGCKVKYQQALQAARAAKPKVCLVTKLGMKLKAEKVWWLKMPQRHLDYWFLTSLLSEWL